MNKPQPRIKPSPLLPRPRIAPELLRRQIGSMVVDGFFQGISRVAQFLPDSRPERHDVEVIRDIPYLQTGSSAHTLDIYRPRNHAASGPLPVVLYIHGGGFRILSKDTHWIMGLFFAKQGFVVVNINYRLAPANPFPAAIEDACAAYVWTVENAARYGGDPSRLVVSGESAGANLATSVTIASTFERPETFASDVFQTEIVPTAVIPACGMLQVSDIDRLARRRPLPRWLLDRLEEVPAAYLPPELPDNIDLADPLLVLESDTEPARQLPPFFAPVGTRDPLLDDTRRLHTALTRRGTPCTVRYYPGEIHAFHAFTWRPQAQKCWDDSFSFLKQHMQ